MSARKNVVSERMRTAAVGKDRSSRHEQQRKGHLSGKDAINLLDKLIQESGPHYYVMSVISKSDPDGFRLKQFEICYVLGLTYIDQKKRLNPLPKQLKWMPLEEFSCHCEIVYDEIVEAIEKELSKSKHVKRVVDDLESQLLDLNKLVTYMQNCL